MILPDRIEGPDRLLLRRWFAEDAEAISRAIEESVEHLRPWMAWITHVEIHHDRANQASAGVPRKLGFEWLGETKVEAAAPADLGIDSHWRMEWARRGTPFRPG